MIELPRVIGHRGAAASAPENTLGSLACAAEQGLTWVEFDVRFARDDVPVVLHDRNLRRTTGIDRNIDDVYSADLAGIDAGSHFDDFWSNERVPTLVQALDACLVLGLTPNVEIKADGGATRALTRAVADIIRSRWPEDRPRPLLSSFSLKALYHARFVGYRWPLGLLMGRKARPMWPWHAKVLRCASIHVDPALATPAFISRVHRAGCRVAVYTVNARKDAEALWEAGVDSVFSDAPGLQSTANHHANKGVMA